MSEERPITDIQFIDPPKPGEGASVVVLGRVADNPEPEHCVHGKTTCVRCNEWCWLGDESYQVVTSRRAYGLCLPCAQEILLPGSGAVPLGNVNDHKRKDGPHI